MVTHEPDIARQMERIIRIRDGMMDLDRDNEKGSGRGKRRITAVFGD